MKNIFLIGFMGAGKSYLGRNLAKQLNLRFYDLDLLIQRYEKLSINDIFAYNGEHYFRNLESSLLLNTKFTGVIATGGGVIEMEINRKFFKKQENETIFLNPPFEILFERIKNTNRPLIKKYDRQKILELWNHRVPLYLECADSTSTNLF